jgi:hypothetical protein
LRQNTPLRAPWKFQRAGLFLHFAGNDIDQSFRALDAIEKRIGVNRNLGMRFIGNSDDSTVP